MSRASRACLLLLVAETSLVGGFAAIGDAGVLPHRWRPRTPPSATHVLLSHPFEGGGGGAWVQMGPLGSREKRGERSIWGAGYTGSLRSNLVRCFAPAMPCGTQPHHLTQCARRVRLRQFCAESVLRFDRVEMAPTLAHWAHFFHTGARLATQAHARRAPITACVPRFPTDSPQPPSHTLGGGSCGERLLRQEREWCGA